VDCKGFSVVFSMRSVFPSVVLVTVTTAVKLDSYAQGQEFPGCIKITDFMTKTLADDVVLGDRDATTGCCAKDYTAGAKWQAAYKGAQIVCGFKADGTIATSEKTSGCTFNKCYVDKQNLACADGSKQLINGCCAKTTKQKDGSFPANCLNYWLSYTTAESDKVNFCTTYHKDYSSATRAGTKDKADDQASGSLVPSAIDTYTPCGGGGAAPTPATPTPPTPPTAVPAPTPTSVGQPGLKRLGADPGTNLAVCQGDCDKDTDCPTNSVCTQRTAGVPAVVPGCTVGDSGSHKDTDYCSNPVKTDGSATVSFSALWVLAAAVTASA